MTLSDLQQHLQAKGIDVSLGWLSEFCKTGDTAQQLGIEGGGNRKDVPESAARILSQFLPDFKAGGFRLPTAPEHLRRFLSSLAVSESGELVPLGNGSGVSQSTKLVPASGSLAVSQTTEALRAAQIQGWASQDAVFTAAEAADFLRVSVRQLRRFVRPSFRIGASAQGDRWRKSDLLSLGVSQTG